MKIVLPRIDHVFDFDEGCCMTIVIENQDLFTEVIRDISEQMQGLDGCAVLSKENRPVPFDKYAELISQFIPFEINQRNLISKVNSCMQQLAVKEDNYMATGELLAEWERFLINLSMNLTGNFVFSKITAESLIKAAGIEFENEYDSLGEELIDYMELVRTYDRDKLFIFVNLRSYLTDEETEIFVKDVIARGMQILLIECMERSRLDCEFRYIVDRDLCLIC